MVDDDGGGDIRAKLAGLMAGGPPGARPPAPKPRPAAEPVEMEHPTISRPRRPSESAPRRHTRSRTSSAAATSTRISIDAGEAPGLEPIVSAGSSVAEAVAGSTDDAASAVSPEAVADAVAALKRCKGEEEREKAVSDLSALVKKAGGAARAACVTAGGVPVLAGAIRSPRVQAQEEAVTVLSLLALSPDHRPHIAAAIDPLVALLGSDRAETQRMAASTLSSLAADNEKQHAAIHAAGGVQALHACARNGSPAVQEAAIGALRHLRPFLEKLKTTSKGDSTRASMLEEIDVMIVSSGRNSSKSDQQGGAPKQPQLDTTAEASASKTALPPPQSEVEPAKGGGCCSLM